MGNLPTYKYLLYKYTVYIHIIVYMSEIEGLAERVFSLRRSMNKNQDEIGAALGLTKSGISSFEKGKSFPSPENLVKLALLFNVSVDYLLTGRDSIRKAENSKEIESPNSPTGFYSQTEVVPSEIDNFKGYTLEDGSAVRPGSGEGMSDDRPALFEPAPLAGQLHQFSTSDSIGKHYEDGPSKLTVHRDALPVYDQSQIDKRFLTELDRLLKVNAFPSYKAWGQAVGVSPSYVASIEKGRYHFNIELLYNTARHFPDFDFVYVLFGSALSARSEPTEAPKRERGRRLQEEIVNKVDIIFGKFREKLKEIIIREKVSESEFWLGNDIDLARDNEVYDLYVSEYGPVKDFPKYLNDMKLIALDIIKELTVTSGKK